MLEMLFDGVTSGAVNFTLLLMCGLTGWSIYLMFEFSQSSCGTRVLWVPVLSACLIPFIVNITNGQILGLVLISVLAVAAIVFSYTQHRKGITRH